jgi:hypothetical protein
MTTMAAPSSISDRAEPQSQRVDSQPPLKEI